MGEDDPGLTTDQRVRRSVARTLGNSVALLILLGVLGAWLSLGAFTLAPGQAAVLLRLGRHAGTVTDTGFHLTLPPPIVLREIINVGEVRNEDFGRSGEAGAAAGAEPQLEKGEEEAAHEAAMQTSDNNIVRVAFSVQFTIKDAFDTAVEKGLEAFFQPSLHQMRHGGQNGAPVRQMHHH